MEKYEIRSDTTLSSFRKQIKRSKSPNRCLPPEIKAKYVSEILSRLRTIENVQALLEIESKWQIESWINKYRNRLEGYKPTKHVIKSSKPVTNESLESELQQAILKVLALETMIDIA